MTGSRRRWLGFGFLGCATIPFLGCALAADIINPDFISGLGLDTSRLLRPAGRVLVAFANETDGPAELIFTTAPDAATLEAGGSGIQIYTVRGEANDVGNEALDCPVGLLAFGLLDEGGQIQQPAVYVGDPLTGDVAEIAYNGSILQNGRDYQCGDMIEVRLVAFGGQDNQQVYDLRIRVVPGR